MAWTQADVDKMKSALASGVLTVTYDGPPRRSITYQSASEMRTTLRDMQREVDMAAGKHVSARYAGFRKGV